MSSNLHNNAAPYDTLEGEQQIVEPQSWLSFKTIGDKIKAISITRQLIFIIILGQCVAFFNSGTAVFSKYLTQKNISVPFMQSLLNYIMLNFYFIPLIAIRIWKYSKARELQLEYYQHLSTLQNDDQLQPTNTQNFNECKQTEELNLTFPQLQPILQLEWLQQFDLLFAPKYTHFWAYCLISLLDVQGNFFIVKAYNYTSMLAVQLIDSANVPFVLLFSYCILSRKFARLQLVACLCCIVGLIMCIFADSWSEIDAGDSGGSSNGNNDNNIILFINQIISIFFSNYNGSTLSSTDSKSKDDGYRSLLGDMLVLIACVCYAMANVIQELVLGRDTTVPTTMPISDDVILYYTRLKACKWDKDRYNVTFTQSKTIPENNNDNNNNNGDDHDDNNNNNIQININNKINHKCTLQTKHQPLNLQDYPELHCTTDQKSFFGLFVIKLQFERIIEYLAMVGLCGTGICSVECFIIERHTIRDMILERSILQHDVLGYFAGFTTFLGMMYFLMPILITNSGAVVLNLSLLMTDVYSAIASYIFFHHKISFIYIIAFVIIGIGLILYNTCAPDDENDIQQSTLQSSSPNLDVTDVGDLTEPLLSS